MNLRSKRLTICLAALALVAALCTGLCLAIRHGDDSELREMVEAGVCPGYVAYAAAPGDEEWKCVGWADREAHRRMDEHTVFRICSMTKSFVGALAAVLADRGDIDLDDRICRTFPEFAGEKATITLRQCLSMTAGFAMLSPTMAEQGTISQDSASVAREMAKVPLVAPPGTKYLYSNPSFEIAAAVIERTANRKLDELLDETFFRPLGMSDTSFYPTKGMERRMAAVYWFREGERCRRMTGRSVVSLPQDGKKGNTSASAGLFSTPHDIERFYEMLLRGGLAEDGTRVMTAGALALITTKQTPPTVAEEYTLGFFREGSWLGHGGVYGTIAECDLSKGCLRMLFAQMNGKDVRGLVRKWKNRAEESYSEIAMNAEAWTK